MASPQFTGSRPPDLSMTLWMLLLTGLWGINAVAIKVLLRGVAPVMGASLRNLIGLGVLSLYGLWRGHSFRYPWRALLHGMLNGLIFAMEFLFSYSGARLTNAGHFALFINTSPLVVALGAHFLFPLERLHFRKVLGLLGAFAGIVLMFSDDLLVGKTGYWRGDLLILVGACMWGLSTLHVKRFIVGTLTPFQLLYIKLLVSTPILLGLSRLMEADPLFGFSQVSALMLAYQGVVVVFFTYQMFMVLLERYPASALQSFGFMTPVWGVLMGMLLLGEHASVFLAAGMLLVGLGLYLITRPRVARA